MKTRKQYLNSECTQEEYYGDIIQEAGLTAARFTPKFLERCRKALEGGDEHLNSIPLAEWDSMGYPARACQAMRNRGDYMTAAGGVIMWKTLAKQSVL